MHRLITVLSGASLGVLACTPPERIPIKYQPINTGAPAVDNDGSKSTPAIATSPNVNNECIFDHADDLDGTVRTGACDADPPASYVMNKLLGVKVTLSAPDVSSGGRIEVRMVFENLSKEKLPVFFYRNPTVKFPMLSLNAKGHDVAFPEGAVSETFTGSIARIVLVPKGTISVKVPYEAIKYKWKKNGKDRDLVEAGGLPKGDYQIRIRFPFAGNVGKVYAKYDLPVRVK